MSATSTAIVQRFSGRKWLRRWVAGAATVVIAFTSLVAGGVMPAQAADYETAGLRIFKTVTVDGTQHDLPNAPPVNVGEEFAWNVTIICDYQEDECVNATFTDTIPDQFEIVEQSINSSIAGDVVVDGQTVTIAFQQPLVNGENTDGQVGLSASANIIIPVKLRAISQDQSGVEIENTASAIADNAPEVSDPAAVTANVPLMLSTEASKAFDPTSALAVSGAPVSLSFGGTNTSNGVVDRLVVQDPADPSATPNIFAQYLQIESLDSVAWPEGAENATVSVLLDGDTEWTSGSNIAAPGDLALPSLSDGATAADIRGIRIEFSATNAAIPQNATTSVQLALSQRDSVEGITANTELSNVSSAIVGVDGDEADDEATATMTLRPVTAEVSASKSFNPDEISITGDTTQSTVTLGAVNTGSISLSELTISEPSNPADVSGANMLAPAFGDGNVTFSGFGSVVWPHGATGAEVTYHFANGSTEVQSTTTEDTLSAAESTLRVTGFVVTFSGDAIVEGAEATVPFTVDAPDSMTEGVRKITGNNEITVSGETGSAVPNPADDKADDDLTIYNEQISIVTEKSLTRTELPSTPGQTTTAQLQATIQPYPLTSTNPTQVIIDDPQSLTGVTDWYEHLDATGIVLTQIPSNSTLTVQYRDAAGNFLPIPGFENLDGSTNGIITESIPPNLHDDITGIRFVYNNPTGFTQNQEFVANVTFTTRDTIRTTGAPIPSVNTDPTDDTPIAVLENCSAAEASAGTLESGRVDAQPCPELTLTPTGPGVGGGPSISKDWSPELVFSHSHQNTTANLNWSTGNLQGLDRIVISDMTADAVTGVPTSLENSSFDAFNLTQVGPINDANFRYDQVQVQIWNGAEWQDLSLCTKFLPCSGTSIPAITLTAAQQEVAEAVRFIVTEKPGRTPTDVNDPMPGTGVSLSDDARMIPLTLQLRDTLRSDPNHPVVQGPTYNVAGTPSQVLNTTSLDGWTDVDDNPDYRDSASDTINILDTVLAVSTTKTWDGSSVAIPQDWATDQAPSTRVTVGVTNQSASSTSVPGYVNELKLTEPGAENPAEERSPFEAFDLIHIQNLTVPQGTDSVLVEFSGAGVPADVTGPTAAATLTALQALEESELRNVTGITVTFTGTIPSGAARGTGTLQFDLELRPTLRTTGADVTTSNSPVRNTVLGSVTDKRWDSGSFVDETLNKQAAAQVELGERDISVTAGKSFNPSSEAEPNNGDLTMTLSGTPSGSERAQSLTLTDDRATFWNAYEFQQVANSLTFPTFSPGGKPLLVEFSVCTGRDFDTWNSATPDPEANCVDTGGSWSASSTSMTAAQAQGWTPTAELGIAPSAVEGIRATFTRTDGVQWENPKSPTVNTPIVIKRLSDLRSGDPVPSTLNDGNEAAPGEPVKGVTTNTVTADVTGIWGGTATDDADATIEYAHAKNAVEVKKDPIGVKNPGSPFDYTLTVRNTGDRDIIHPVITDRLPRDATLGTLVQFDPDASETDARYSYTLSGTNPTAGTPMPTNLDNIDVVEDLTSATPTIGFTFPIGTRLAPGQTYTIVFSMMFIDGVTEGQAVVNGFDIVGDRVWDECTAPTSATDHTAQLKNNDTECYTEAKVTPQRLPLIRTVKSVRVVNDTAGEFNDHGFVDDAACVNRVDGDDFAIQPCVPRSMPGQTEDWRLTVTNNGTTPLTRVAVADLLPTPGDKTLIANFDRKSQWTPTLSDTTPTLTGSGLEGATLTTYVTTAAQADICMATVNDPSDLSCIDETGVDTTKFVPFDSLADKSAATALLFMVDAPAPKPLAPGAVLNLGFQTQTGPFSQQIGEADPKAFNSLTVSALYPDGATTRVMTARDQSRVGVALITGSVQVEKTVTGPAAGFVPDGQVFSGTLECTSQGIEIPDRAFTVVAGTPTVIENLPAGAICSADETAASGQTSFTVSSDVTVPSDDTATVPSLTITNDYQLTELVVKKQVVTDATQFPTGFGFEAECTFLGQAIDLDAADAAFTLDHNGEHTITGLPVNSECVITETDDRGADSTSVEAESLNADGTAHGTVTESGDSATIDGLAFVDDPDAATDEAGSNVAEFTNIYGDQAALRVEKDLVGGAADLGDDLSFNVDVLCTFEGETLYDDTLTLNKGNGWGEGVPSLVAGAECTITEPDLNGADAVLITPNDGADATTGEVTIPSDATEAVLVTVTNRYLAGSLEVTKAVLGDGAELYGTGDFVVSLLCTLDGDTVRVLDGATRTVSADTPTAEYTGLPSGAICTLTETDNAGATDSQMRAGDSNWSDATDPGITFTVGVDETVASNDDQAQIGIDVENYFDLAEVSVTKTVETDAVDADGVPIGYGPFEVALECTFLGEAIPVTDAVRSIADGETVTWVDLPAGAQCEVEETNAADADETWFLQAGAVDPDADPAADLAADPAADVDPVRTDGALLALGALNALGTEANEATLVNHFDSTTLLIAKALGGNDADSAKGETFEFTLLCSLTDQTRPDGAEVWNGTLEVSAATNWLAQVDGLATGAECVLTETVAGDADRTTIAINGDVIAGGTEATFTVDDTQLALKVTNTFTKALVTTGGMAVGYLAMLGALLMLGGAVFAARRKHGRQNEQG